MQRSIRFFFDVPSFYSYVGLELLRRQTREWARSSSTAVRVELVPFQVHYVFKKCRNSRPSDVPHKSKYMREDIARTSKLAGFPWDSIPDPFPFNSKSALLALTAISRRYGNDSLDSEMAAATLAVMRAAWTDVAAADGSGRRVRQVPDSVDTVVAALERAGITSFSDGASVADVVNAAQNDVDTLNSLRTNSSELLEKFNGFGAPSLLVSTDGPGLNETLIWGSDRLETVANMLDLPYTPIRNDSHSINAKY